MKTSKKTNAARILDELHIPYELKTYPVDEDHWMRCMWPGK